MKERIENAVRVIKNVWGFDDTSTAVGEALQTLLTALEERDGAIKKLEHTLIYDRSYDETLALLKWKVRAEQVEEREQNCRDRIIDLEEAIKEAIEKEEQAEEKATFWEGMCKEIREVLEQAEAAYEHDMERVMKERNEAEARVKELEKMNKAWEESYQKESYLHGATQNDKLQALARLTTAREALLSISKNTCCDKCQEAALVAQQALEKMRKQTG